MALVDEGDMKGKEPWPGWVNWTERRTRVVGMDAADRKTQGRGLGGRGN
jgi:hypothetical protein